MRPRVISTVLVAGLACGPTADADRPAAAPGAESAKAGSAEVGDAAARWLFAWAGDVDRRDRDFLAVLDADPASPRYGTVVATAPVDARGSHPHHTEHRLPEGGVLFANGFMAGTTWRFDLSDPAEPRVLGSFGARDGWTYPHSYERTPEGTVLATFQGRGEQNVDPGALVELAPDGATLRAASAADPASPDALIRPYSLAIVPELDRVVVTSYDMGEDMGFRGGRRGRTEVVQVWRLSDLVPLATIDLPDRAGRDEQPGEPRVLADGQTVLVSTFTCGLWRITGLGTDAPGAELVHAFDGGGCAVPVVVGDFWVQSVPSANAVVALDVSDPSSPREMGRVELGSRSFPHWLALDRGGSRIVVADRGDGERRLHVLTIDPSTGALAVDERFRDAGSDRPGVSFDRQEWPHGPTGPARPHGTVFGP